MGNVANEGYAVPALAGADDGNELISRCTVNLTLYQPLMLQMMTCVCVQTGAMVDDGWMCCNSCQ